MLGVSIPKLQDTTKIAHLSLPRGISTDKLMRLAFEVGNPQGALEYGRTSMGEIKS